MVTVSDDRAKLLLGNIWKLLDTCPALIWRFELGINSFFKKKVYQTYLQNSFKCILLTSAPFFVKYPSLIGLIVLDVPAEPDRMSESLV